MDEEREKKNEKNGGSDMKKYCLIMKTEEYSGITYSQVKKEGIELGQYLKDSIR